MCRPTIPTAGATISAFTAAASCSDDEVHRRKQINPDYTKVRNARNNYLQDRQKQKTVNFTGIDDFLNHDGCATESMGAIFDRTKEHLGVSDKAVIAVRKFLLTTAKELQAGKEPPHLVRDPAQQLVPAHRLLRPFGAARSAVAKEVRLLDRRPRKKKIPCPTPRARKPHRNSQLELDN